MDNLKHALGKILIPRLPVNRRTFDILRFELGCLTQRLYNAVNPRYHAKLRALKTREGVSVNLGSGGKGLNGWINIDARPFRDTYIAYDIRRLLPFSAGQVIRIMAEHVVEHLDFREDIPQVFSEFYRILAR